MICIDVTGKVRLTGAYFIGMMDIEMPFYEETTVLVRKTAPLGRQLTTLWATLAFPNTVDIMMIQRWSSCQCHELILEATNLTILASFRDFSMFIEHSFKNWRTKKRKLLHLERLTRFILSHGIHHLVLQALRLLTTTVILDMEHMSRTFTMLGWRFPVRNPFNGLINGGCLKPPIDL